VLRVALQEYQSRIEGLIEENRLPEAAAHCHFLLQQYPRHIGTYRLFGRALLEQQLYNDTLDIFKRVISADPEDLLAHAGLALAYREKKDLNRALWHMERAYEMEPYNRAIQNELHDLHERLDMDPVQTFGLNRAALARIYFKGGLYGKAAIETKALLENNADRFDLQVLLADIYYWADRSSDADQQCQLILNQLPFCIKPNAILADIRLRKGHVQEAKRYLSTLQSVMLMALDDVDPESTVGYILTHHPDINLPEQISVDALGEIGPASAQLSYDSEWLHEIGVEQEIAIRTIPPVEEYDAIIDTIVPEESLELLNEDEVDWLEELSIDDIAANTHQGEEIAAAPLETVEVVDEGEVSQPLMEEVEETVEFEQAPAVIEDEIPDRDLSLDEFGDELPSWTELNEEVGLVGTQISAEAVDDSWLAQIAPSQSSDDGLPKWIYENMGFSTEMEDSPDFELPDWLQDSMADDDTAREEPESPELPLETEPIANQGASEKPESMLNLEEVGSVADEITAISFEEDLSLEPSIEELLTGTDELINRTTSPPPDQPVDAIFDALPWLDDMFTVEETEHEEEIEQAGGSAEEDKEPLNGPHTKDE